MTGTSAFAALALVHTDAVSFAISADGPNTVVLTYGAPLAFLAGAV